MKRFQEFMEDADIATSKLLLEQKKRKKKSDVEKRMSDAYAKKKRMSKIKKLLAVDSHWRNLS
tara:strand:- start:1967 stop:2155 length:189 start_codon:yes stop_codon:yes gene_type:complete